MCNIIAIIKLNNKYKTSVTAKLGDQGCVQHDHTTDGKSSEINNLRGQVPDSCLFSASFS